jgi:hypothetical protein
MVLSRSFGEQSERSASCCKERNRNSSACRVASQRRVWVALLILLISSMEIELEGVRMLIR